MIGQNCVSSLCRNVGSPAPKRAAVRSQGREPLEDCRRLSDRHGCPRKRNIKSRAPGRSLLPVAETLTLNNDVNVLSKLNMYSSYAQTPRREPGLPRSG